MNQYEQYQKFYRLLRKGMNNNHLFTMACEFDMVNAYEDARKSLWMRKRTQKTLVQRLREYKARKAENSSMAYAA